MSGSSVELGADATAGARAEAFPPDENKLIAERPAVKRGRMVNRASGPPEGQLHERHDAGDFQTKTQDKIGARG